MNTNIVPFSILDVSKVILWPRNHILHWSHKITSIYMYISTSHVIICKNKMKFHMLMLMNAWMLNARVLHHTHSWHVGQDSRRRREAPPIIGGPAGALLPLPDAPQWLHRYLLASIQGSTCSIILHPWLYDSLIQWRRMKSTRIDNVVME